jgi:acid phosphatase class B
MKKLFTSLSMLCLLALLVMPLVACQKEEPVEVEDTAAVGTETTATDTTMTTDTMTTDTTMSTDMGTDMGGEPTGTNMEPPPAQ